MMAATVIAAIDQHTSADALFAHLAEGDFLRVVVVMTSLVSKHRDSTYRGGRCDRWVKVRTGRHPAFSRVRDQF
jgi:hypothetical protein